MTAQRSPESVPWPVKTPPATRLDPLFWTVEEVARLLDLHPNTIYRWCADGGMPSVHLGVAVRIPRRGFADWIAAQKRHGSTLKVSNKAKKRTA